MYKTWFGRVGFDRFVVLDENVVCVKGVRCVSYSFEFMVKFLLALKKIIPVYRYDNVLTTPLSDITRNAIIWDLTVERNS